MFKLFLAAITAAFMLSGCNGGDGNVPTEDVMPATDPGSYSALPITQAQIDTALSRLDAIAQNALEVSGVPGMAVAVVHNDKTV